MFTIIRWIFSIALLILVVYLLLLGYNSIKKEGITSVWNPISSGVSNLLGDIGLETTATATKNIFANLFTPRQVAAPLVVVPSAAWYENMDALYKQIYLNNLNYAGMNTSGSFNYDAYFQQYNQTATTLSPTQVATSSKLQILFPTPSTYMQLRNYLNDTK